MAISGLSTTASSGSGLDVESIVSQLMYVERAPERLWQAQQQRFDAQASTLRELQSRLSTLEERLNTLRDVSGVFSKRTVTSSDADLLTATAESGTATGIHAVAVERLATTASWYTQQLPSANASFSENTSFDISIGGHATHVSFDAAHKTLATAATHINSLGLSVTASVVSDANGARLAIVSNATGAAGDIVISNDTTGLGFVRGAEGLNAKLAVDGVPVESSQNTVRGAIAGVTLTLTAANQDREIRLSVASDQAAIKQAIHDYADAHNAAITLVNQQFTYDQASKSSGVLAADASLRIVQESLLKASTFSMTGNDGYSSLSLIGVKMQNDGTLKVDDSILSDVVNGHGKELQKLFDTTVAGSFGATMNADLGTLNDSATGVVALDLSGAEANSKNLASHITAFEQRMLLREQTLLDQYSRIDVMLRQFSTLQSQISQQLSSLSTT